MTFNDLKLIDPILRALETKGYTEPTQIQAEAIPQILARRDVLGCAQTGTGKTAAFAIPIIQLIHQIEQGKDRATTLRALILTPTRELAIQIEENLEAYARYTFVKHTAIFGGVKQQRQVNRLQKGVHILVATPGRLLDLIKQGFISLDTIKMFVLDEADRMLDMGFLPDIKRVIALLPEKRQSLFFSATMPNNIVKLSRSILTNPIRIDVSPTSSAAETVKQFLYYTNRTDKRDLLYHILDDREIDQALLFARTKHGADRIVRHLNKKKIKSEAIHGNKSQNHRQRVLQRFKDGDLRILVATDIASRGIDIDKLKYVINYDIPNEPETYVHRIGRSGRAGESGISISICEPEENAYVRDIEQLIDQKIESIDENPFPQTDKPMTEAEKKAWNKEKARKKQEFFKKRKEAQANKAQAKKKSSPSGGGKNGKRRNGRRGKRS